MKVDKEFKETIKKEYNERKYSTIRIPASDIYSISMSRPIYIEYKNERGKIVKNTCFVKFIDIKEAYIEYSYEDDSLIYPSLFLPINSILYAFNSEEE